MVQEAVTLTFLIDDGDVPASVRTRNFLKAVGRRYGLRCIADVRTRDLERQRCFRALCPDCAAGHPVMRGEADSWWHKKTGHSCGATALRVALEKTREIKTAGGGAAAAASQPRYGQGIG